MSKIYYAITPSFSNVTRYAKEGDTANVYDKVMFITDNHEEAENAAGWCYVAEVGEVYETDQFRIEVIEED